MNQILMEIYGSEIRRHKSDCMTLPRCKVNSARHLSNARSILSAGTLEQALLWLVYNRASAKLAIVVLTPPAQHPIAFFT